MQLPQLEVYEILKAQGVQELHHANSVLTARSFLEKGALLSRGTAAERGLKQTKQRSDESDKEVGVDFDVFVDSVDLHQQASNVCFYGPVMFVLDLDILLEETTGGIWVSKHNAEDFGGIDSDHRWFKSLRELKDDFVSTTFDHQIVLRHCDGVLPFGRYLKRVVLDDPAREDVFAQSRLVLESAISEGGLDVPVEKRVCRSQCGCSQFYEKASKGFLMKMFSSTTYQLAVAWG